MKSTLLLHKDLRVGKKKEMCCTAISSAKWGSILDRKDLRASKCGKGRWRIFGTLILANYTKGTPQWTGRNANTVCELLNSNMEA
jgi:hypothetical protein